MFSEQSIIDLLQPTGYNVEEFPDTEFDVYSVIDTRLPIIYVGYATIDAEKTSLPLVYDLYHQHGENLIQHFDIRIVCNKEDLPTLFIAVHGALVGKVPAGQIQDTIGLTLAQSGLMGKNNGICHWLSRYRVALPTLFTLF